MDEIIRAIPVFGTLTNAGAIVAGGALGLLLRSRFPERLSVITFQAMGLFSLTLGFSMAAKSTNPLILVFSIVVGAVFGELLDLEERTNRLAELAQQRLAANDEGFAKALVTTFLLFGMGSMGVLGSIEEGLGGYPTLLFAKALLDGVASIALGAALGAGVLLAAFPLALYQSSITLLASMLSGILTPPVMNEISATGGLMILAIGFSLLGIVRIRVMNLLPGIIVAAILGHFLLTHR